MTSSPEHSVNKIGVWETRFDFGESDRGKLGLCDFEELFHFASGGLQQDALRSLNSAINHSSRIKYGRIWYLLGLNQYFDFVFFFILHKDRRILTRYNQRAKIIHGFILRKAHKVYMICV